MTPKTKRLLALTGMIVLPTTYLATSALGQAVGPEGKPLVGATKVGERQSRDEAAPSIAPTARIANRIQSRIQNRIRNRIDRFYSPQNDTSAPFDAATENARQILPAKPR